MSHFNRMSKAASVALALLLAACGAGEATVPSAPSAPASSAAAPQPATPSVVVLPDYIRMLTPGYVEMFGNLKNSAGSYFCGREYCEGASAEGACGPRVTLRCTCLAGLEIFLHTEEAGTCTVNVTLHDDLGVRGTSQITFDLATIRRGP